MWDQMIQGMMEASLSDWIWHIVAIVFAIYITVPGLWWPHVEKYMKKKREKELLLQQQAEARKQHQAAEKQQQMEQQHIEQSIAEAK